MTYMSPEQKWLLTELKKIDKCADYAMYCAVKEEWQITPATSDLFQASLTVLEMHARAARWIGVGSIAPHEAVQENVARIPVDKVRKMNPAKAESWLVEQLGNVKLAGKIESSGIDGSRLLEIAKMTQKEAAAALGIKMARAIVSQLAIRRNVATPADTMHEKIAVLLEKTLAVDVGERPVTAEQALELLGATDPQRNKSSKVSPTTAPVSYSDAFLPHAVGYAALPPAAMVAVSEHPDETTAATLGGLAKTLVIHNDVAGALAACAEWWGAASSAEARNTAANAYRNLWKRHGTSLRSLDLSRAAQAHWREEMFSDVGLIRRLTEDIAHSGASMIEMIDLSEQPQLEGAVLEDMFSVCASSLSKLLTLKLRNCPLVSCTIPASIRACMMLQTLDLSRTGP